MLRAFGTSRQARGLPLEVSAEDHMDDGSPICLRVQINLNQVRLEKKMGQGTGLWGEAHSIADSRTFFSPEGRAAPYLTSVVPGLRCLAISMPREP